MPRLFGITPFLILLLVAECRAQPSVHELETRILADAADYCSTPDNRAALALTFRKISGTCDLRFFDIQPGSTTVFPAGQAEKDWITAVTTAVKPNRSDEKAPIKDAALSALLTDALQRCLALQHGARTATPPIDLDHWVFIRGANSDPQFRAFISYNSQNGSGYVSVAGIASPQPLRLESDRYEGPLLEMLREHALPGVHIAGQRGALVWDESADKISLKLASPWSALPGWGTLKTCPAATIHTHAAAYVKYVLHPDDRRGPFASRGEIDPFIEQLVIRGRERSPVDPLVWILKSP